MSNYKDLEKRRETQRKWWAANKERLREHSKKYQREYKRKIREQDPEQRLKEREARKEYYARNKEEEQRKAREYMRNYYETHKQEMNEKNRSKYAKRKEWFKDFLSTQKCCECGISDIDCLDFHHVNPNGKREPTIPSLLCHSEKRIKEEMAKCVILCANCHRKEHARLRREITQ